MSEKKREVYATMASNPDHVHMDCKNIIDEIQSNHDNPYIKFPNYTIAHEIGYSLGFNDCENNYMEKYWEDDEEMTESQRFILMAFKQGFKEGIIHSAQEETKLFEKHKIEELRQFEKQKMEKLNKIIEEQNTMSITTCLLIKSLIK